MNDTHNLYLKHTGLPIQDMTADIKLDHPNMVVTMELGHFDSWLLISACKSVEEHFSPVRLIDTESHATWGPALIEHRYRLILKIGDVSFYAKVVQLGNYTREDRKPDFTVSMHLID